jgi:hypothetical protein
VSAPRGNISWYLKGFVAINDSIFNSLIVSVNGLLLFALTKLIKSRYKTALSPQKKRLYQKIDTASMRNYLKI